MAAVWAALSVAAPGGMSCPAWRHSASSHFDRRPGRVPPSAGYILAAWISLTGSAPVAMDSSRSADHNEDDDAHA
jgi:hypothetical protein